MLSALWAWAWACKRKRDGNIDVRLTHDVDCAHKRIHESTRAHTHSHTCVWAWEKEWEIRDENAIQKCTCARVCVRVSLYAWGMACLLLHARMCALERGRYTYTAYIGSHHYRRSPGNTDNYWESHRFQGNKGTNVNRRLKQATTGVQWHVRRRHSHTLMTWHTRTHVGTHTMFLSDGHLTSIAHSHTHTETESHKYAPSIRLLKIIATKERKMA